MSKYDSLPLRDLESLRKQVGGEAHPVATRKVFELLEPHSQAFIARSPFLLLATSDREGGLDVSPKGDAAGFVWVQDEHTLWIPDRPGNKLIFGLQNILQNPRVGIVFLIPGTQETLRVNGRAELHAAPELLEQLAARGRPALLAIRVEVQECFFHCAKSFRRSGLWQPDSWPDPFRVSFGDVLAPRIGGGEQEAREIDEVVEADYRDHL